MPRGLGIRGPNIYGPDGFSLVNVPGARLLLDGRGSAASARRVYDDDPPTNLAEDGATVAVWVDSLGDLEFDDNGTAPVYRSANGGAVDFQGADNRLNCTTGLPATSEHHLFWWIDIDSTPSNSQLLRNSNASCLIYLDTGGTLQLVENASTFRDTTYSVSTGLQLLDLRLGGGAGRLAVDGVDVGASFTYTGSNCDFYSATTQFGAGSAGSFADYKVRRFFSVNRVLTGGELTGVRNAMQA